MGLKLGYIIDKKIKKGFSCLQFSAVNFLLKNHELVIASAFKALPVFKVIHK